VMIFYILIPYELRFALSVAPCQIYTSANDMFSKTHRFDNTTRNGPKVY